MKRVLRSQYQQRIESISFMDLVQKSGNLSERFQELIHSVKVSIVNQYIVSFYPFKTEPQINIESEQRNEPYRVAYVRIKNWDQRLMEASEARRDQPGEWEEFEVGESQKIFQPHAQQKVCNPADVTAILVPAMAFTNRGERLGRGAGFYDRFLLKYPQALRIGIGFEEQMADQLPTEAWDQKVDVIVTDHKIHEILNTNELGEWRSRGKVLNRLEKRLESGTR